MKSPNILYFVVHDLGRHLGCYGAPIHTPHLDTFADESVRFNQAFCNSPACSPSRNCAMTGQYAHTSGGIGLAHMGWPLPESVQTIVDYLNGSGYETIHAGMEHERHPRRNRYEVDLQTDWDDLNTHVGVDKALDHLRKRDRARPFYLNIGSQQPHPSTWHRSDELHGGAVPGNQAYVPSFLPDAPPVRESLGRFQAAIRYMDREFGRLMEGLEELGHDRDTIVVFTTDHGIAFPRGKGTLYDRGTEIALLARMPDGRGAGTTCDELIQNIDFTPTMLDAVGVELPDCLQGRSFWPLLVEKDYSPHDALFIERNFHGELRLHHEDGDFIDRYDPVRSIRTKDFHLIKHFDPTIKGRDWLPWEVPIDAVRKSRWGDCLPPASEPRPEVQLFHVGNDPQEFIDVAGRPEFQSIRADLEQRLEDWMRATDDFVLRGEVPQRREEPGWGGWPENQ